MKTRFLILVGIVILVRIILLSIFSIVKRYNNLSKQIEYDKYESI
ncbi:hypothetical protein [Nitrosopumilus sp.]|nr:hypothetical protein [Nitrosopumilus sp.]